MPRQLLTQPGLAQAQAPPKKKLKTVNAPTEPVPVAANGEEDEEDFDEEELDDDPALEQLRELEEVAELDNEEDEDGYDEEGEGEEDEGVDEPKKLGIDVDLPSKGKTQAATEIAANGDEADD